MVTAKSWQRRHPVAFGRRTRFANGDVVAQAPGNLMGDLRLFVMFFIGGLTFMSVYLA